MTKRQGHYMRTYTGRRYWPLDPRPEDVVIADIAHALALQGRFNGHTRNPKGPHHFYSVAEHSVICSLQSDDPALALELLMHDAAEAYTGDLIRPLKMIPELRDVWAPIEIANEKVIAQRFNLEFPWCAETQRLVKRVDMEVCQAELIQAMHGAEENSADLMEGEFRIADITVEFWTPSWAERCFLERFYDLVRVPA